MQRLCDDELGSVLERVSYSSDRKSCSEVCRQWARVEGKTRSSLRVKKRSQFWPRFLLRFPNLRSLEIHISISNQDLGFIARTYSNLQHFHQSGRVKNLESGTDADDDGLIALAAGCRKLKKVVLHYRERITYVGVAALAKNAEKLSILDLSCCSNITDPALEAISALESLTALYLRDCVRITDVGLASLATGSTSRSLRILDLSECSQISDCGVCRLSEMSGLQDLRLGWCSDKITDEGGVAISSISSLRKLDLCDLDGISNITLFAVAENCPNLVEICVDGCKWITGAGIRAFAGHGSLQSFSFAYLPDVDAGDVGYLVLRSKTLNSLVLDSELEKWMPRSIRKKLNRLVREWR